MSLIQVVKGNREKVQNAISKHNLKQVDIAKETGINHSSLSLWLQGKIKGHEKLTAKIEQGMTEWLINFEKHRPSLKEPEKPIIIDYGEDVDCLIPVSVDTEIDGVRYKELFCWNASEPQLTAEQFAKIICDENQFPPSIEQEIIQAIKRAVNNYKPYKFQASNEEHLRIIEIQIRIDNIQYKDQFEWDINDPNNSPEAFSWSLAEELGLEGEFALRIAHQVREQIQFYQKQILDKKQAGIFDDKTYKKQTRSIYEINQGYNQYDVSKQNIQPEVITKNNYIRPFQTMQDPDYLQQWEPQVDVLDANEIRKVQKLEERKYRYAKRIRP